MMYRFSVVVVLLGAFLPGRIAMAEGRSIGLIQCELDVLRVLLDNAPSESGLKDLSESGKKVIKDLQNATVTLSDTGLWQYRHLGNNRVLQNMQGAPADLAVIERSLECESYSALTALGDCGLQTRSLALTMSEEAGQARVDAYLTRIQKNQNLSAPVKRFATLRVGSAIARLPVEIRSQVLVAKQGRPSLRRALVAAIESENRRLGSIRRATTSGADSHVTTAFREALRPSSNKPEDLESRAWRRAEGTKGTVFVIELSPDLKGYLVLDPSIRETPDELIESGKWKRLVREGKIKVYYGELNKAALVEVEAQRLTEDGHG